MFNCSHPLQHFQLHLGKSKFSKKQNQTKPNTKPKTKTKNKQTNKRVILLNSETKTYRGPAPFHRLTPNKRFEPVFSTVIMAVCSLFNRMLLLTDLIPVHLLYCGQTVMIGCNHASFEWTRAVRHIYGIIRHMQGLYTFYVLGIWTILNTLYMVQQVPKRAF